MASFPYAFSPKRPVRREFVRVLKRISARLAKLGKQRGDKAETVHELRTLIKLLRALLWFAKPAFRPTTSAYAKIELQNAARLLSGRRDAAVMQSTLKELADEADTSEERQAVKRALDLLPSRTLKKKAPAEGPRRRAGRLRWCKRRSGC